MPGCLCHRTRHAARVRQSHEGHNRLAGELLVPPQKRPRGYRPLVCRSILRCPRAKHGVAPRLSFSSATLGSYRAGAKLRCGGGEGRGGAGVSLLARWHAVEFGLEAIEARHPISQPAKPAGEGLGSAELAQQHVGGQVVAGDLRGFRRQQRVVVTRECAKGLEERGQGLQKSRLWCCDESRPISARPGGKTR